MEKPGAATVLMRIAVAMLLGFGAMMVAARLDPRFQPVFATWLSSESARVPYMAAAEGGDALLAALLTGAAFILLSLGRGRRSAWALAAVAVVVAALTARGRPRSCEPPMTDLGRLAPVVRDHRTDPGCGDSFTQTTPASAVTTTIACFSRAGFKPGEGQRRQRTDALLVTEGLHQLRVQRVCVDDDEGTRTVCRWRAGPVGAGDLDPSAEIDLDKLPYPADPDDFITVEAWPWFDVFRVSWPAGAFWLFSETSGREEVGTLLAGHGSAPPPLGAVAITLATFGAGAAVGLLLLMERSLRRERRRAGARTGILAEDVVTFTDGSSARVVGDRPSSGTVTVIAPAAVANDDSAYRDLELIDAARLARGTTEQLATTARRTAAACRVLLLAIVALTAVPVVVAWCRAPIPLPPLPLAQVERAL